MPINKKGGKGHKKCKNSIYRDEVSKKVEYRQEDNNEVYGVITKIYGSGRFLVLFYDDLDKKKAGTPKEKMGILRGNLRRRTRLCAGNLVLVSVRSFQEDKVDIIYKYKDYEISDLKKRNFLNNTLVESMISTNNENDSAKSDLHNTNFEEDEITFEKQEKVPESYQNVIDNLISDSESEYSEEEDNGNQETITYDTHSTNNNNYDDFGNMISDKYKKDKMSNNYNDANMDSMINMI
jgi:translation initiation factor 1A